MKSTISSWFTKVISLAAFAFASVFGFAAHAEDVAQIGATKYESLQQALTDAIAANDGAPVELLGDIDLTGTEWTPVVYGTGKLTIDGKGFTVKGLSDALLNKQGSGGHYLKISNVTFKDATVSSTSDYAAVIVSYADVMNELSFTNVTIDNANVTSGKYAGAFVAYAAGWNVLNNGPVFQQIKFDGCKVVNSTIKGKGSVGGLMGHAAGNVAAKIVVTDTEVSGNTVTSTGSDTNKAGSLFGTVGAAGDAGTLGMGGIEVAATVSGNTVSSGGTTITTIYGRQGTSTGILTLTGGTYDAQPIADTDSSWAKPATGYVVTQSGDKWIVGVKVDTDPDNKATLVTKPSDSTVQTQSLPQDVASALAAEVTVGGKTTTVGDQINQNTTVEGVKLTTTKTETAPAGVQAVVDSAKAEAAKGGNEDFTSKIASAQTVEVKVDVAVTPVEYVAPTEDAGTASYQLTPTATVKIMENGQAAASQNVPVTDAMLDKSQKIAVSVFMGFKPAQIFHYTDAGDIIEVFTGDQIAYDEATGIATVLIDHFSIITGFKTAQAIPVATLYKDGVKDNEFATIKDAVSYWNATNVPGDYKIVVLNNTYDENDIKIWQNVADRKLTLQAKTAGMVTIKPTSGTHVFFIDGWNDTSKANVDIVIDGINVDLTESSAHVCTFCTATASARGEGSENYARNVTFQNATLSATSGDENYGFYSDRGSYPFGILVKDCTIAGLDYVGTSYFKDKNVQSADRPYALAFVGCDITCGGFLNNQQPATILVESCKIKSTKSYVIRSGSDSNPMTVILKNTQIEDAYSGTDKGGVVVCRAADTVTIENCQFTKTGSAAVWDVQATKSKAFTITAGSYLVDADGKMSTPLTEPVQRTGNNSYDVGYDFGDFVAPAASVTSADGKTTTKYTTLQAAINAVKQGETIDVLANNSEAITVDKTCSFTLKSNGYTMGAAPTVTAAGYEFVQQGNVCTYFKPVAKITVGETTTKYEVLTNAVKEVTADQTITMLQSVTEDVTAKSPNANFTLDLGTYGIGKVCLGYDVEGSTTSEALTLNGSGSVAAAYVGQDTADWTGRYYDLNLVGPVTLNNLYLRQNGRVNVNNASVRVGYNCIYGAINVVNKSTYKVTGANFYLVGRVSSDKMAMGKAVITVDDSALDFTGTYGLEMGGGSSGFKGSASLVLNKATATGTMILLGDNADGSLGKIAIDSTDSTLTLSGKLMIGVGDTVSLKNSSVTLKEIANNGTITVDMTGATKASYKIIDYTGTAAMTLASYGTANVTGGEYELIVVDNDLVAVKQTIHVYSADGTKAFYTPKAAMEYASTKSGEVKVDFADYAYAYAAPITSDEGVCFNSTGVYTLTNGVGTLFNYEVQLNSEKKSDVNSAMVIANAHVTASKLNAYTNAKLTIKDSTFDFDGFQNGCSYLGIKKNSSLLIENSTVGNKTKHHSGYVNFFGPSTTIYGTAMVSNSTLYASVGQGEDGLTVSGNGALTVMDATVNMAFVDIGSSFNTGYCAEGDVDTSASIVLDNGKMYNKQYAGDQTGDRTEGVKIGDGTKHAGTLTLKNGSILDLTGASGKSVVTVAANGAIAIDATSQIKCSSVANGGTITVDMTGATAKRVTLVDASAASTYGTYAFAERKDNDYTLKVIDNDLVAVKYAAQVTSADGQTVTKYETLEAAVDAVQENETIEVLADNTEAITVTTTVPFKLKSNGKTMGAAPSVPEGYKFVKDGNVCTYQQIVYVAQIGVKKFETLAEALKAATSGDTIEVLDGTWDADAVGTLTTAEANVVRYKTLTIQPAEGATVKFTSQVYLGYDDSSTANASMTVKNIGFEGASLAISNYNQVYVEGCTFKDTSNTAGTLIVQDACCKNHKTTETYPASQITIKDCVIDGSNTGASGIRLRNSGNVSITGCTVKNSQFNGILFESNGSVDNTVAKAITVTGNTITEWNATNANEGGRALRMSLGNGNTLAEGSTVTIENNTFTKAKTDLDSPDFIKITGSGTASVNLNDNSWNNNFRSWVSGNSSYYTVDGATPALTSVTTTKKARACVVETGLEYETVPSAYSAALDGQTVKVLVSHVYSRYITPGTDGKTVTLDLNGKTLGFDTSYYGWIVWGGTLIVTDSSATLDENGYEVAAGTGKITCTSYDPIMLYNANTKCIVNAGSIESSGEAVYVYGAGASFEMNGGTVKAGTYGVYVSGGGSSFTMNGGTVKAPNNFAVCLYPTTSGQNCAFTMNGGLIKAGSGIANSGNNHWADATTVAITGGAIEVDGWGAYHAGNGTFAMSGGSITAGNTGVEMRAGYLTVSGGTITSTAEEVECDPNASGTTVSGAAIALSQHLTNLDIGCTVSGGTLTGPCGLFEVDVGDPTAGNPAAISVTGGRISSVASANCTGFVSGGIYTEAPDTEYVAAGKRVVDNPDVETQEAYPYAIDFIYVAKILRTGEVYTTLDAAVAAAQADDTIQMLEDCDPTNAIEFSTSVTLDLNGKTIGGDAFVQVPGHGNGLLAVRRGATLTIDDSSDDKLGRVVGNATSSKLYAAVAMTITADGATGATAGLVLNAGTLVGGYYGIVGNGTRHDTSIVINGGMIDAQDGYAIFNPQNGTVKIAGGVLVGTCSAVEIRSGSLTVSGGTLTSTSTTYEVKSNDSGTTTMGAALAIAQHTTQNDISVSITGGSFVGVKALSERNPQGNEPVPTVTLSVTGGRFLGGVVLTDVSHCLDGGVYSERPDEEFVADGKDVLSNGDAETKDVYPYAIGKKEITVIDIPKVDVTINKEAEKKDIDAKQKDSRIDEKHQQTVVDTVKELNENEAVQEAATGIQQANTQQSAAGMDIITNIVVELKAIKIEDEDTSAVDTKKTCTSATFDVMPINDESNKVELAVGVYVTFRLPISSNVTDKVVQIFHSANNGATFDSLGYYPIQKSDEGERYVEITAHDFSYYKYESESVTKYNVSVAGTPNRIWVNVINSWAEGKGKAVGEETLAYLETKQANGFQVWQNYVMGVDGTSAAAKLTPVCDAADTVGTVVTVKAALGTPTPMVASGVEVSYSLIQMSGVSGTAEQTSDTPVFAVDTATLPERTSWKIRVNIDPED